MKTLTLFLSALLLGYLWGRQTRADELAVEVDDLMSPTTFRRTVRLRNGPQPPVPKGAPKPLF
jgi:hypothetical protein